MSTPSIHATPGRPRALRAAALAALAALAVGACADQGEGWVRGDELEVDDCLSVGVKRRFEPFAMKLSQLALERDDGVALMRFVPRLRLSPPPDQLAVTVDGIPAIRAEISAAGFAERAIGADGPVHVGLNLFDTCPASHQPLVASSGTARFARLGVDKGATVRASFVFELADQRTGAWVGRGFEAEVDFDIEVGPPYQPFNDPTAQKH